MSNWDPADSEDPLTVEKAFEHIERGNTSEDGFETSQEYSQAARILSQLETDDPKVAKLYQSKAFEYLKLSRESFVEILSQETAQDTVTDDGTSELLQGLAESRCEERLQLFGRLFAKEAATEAPSTDDLEARLESLQASFPSHLKSEQERVRDLNQGLRRLGLSTIEDKPAPPALQIPSNLNEHDQLESLLEQAKVEAQLNPAENDDDGEEENEIVVDPVDTILDAVADDTDASKVADDEGDNSEKLQDNDSDADWDVTPEIANQMYEELLETQVQISQLLVLFQVGDDNTAEVEFDPARGNELLVNTQRSVKGLLRAWNKCRS